MQPSDVLIKGRDLLRDHGIAFDTYMDADGGMCSITALNRAAASTGTFPTPTRFGTSPLHRFYRDAHSALARSLGGPGCISVSKAHDAIAGEPQKVFAAWDRAIQLAKAEEAAATDVSVPQPREVVHACQ